ncbi:MAG TPA: FMN-binding protein [Streptosporangiaceae bacterium]
MRSAPWLVLGGTLAGFLGVLGLHKPATPNVLANRPAQHTTKASPGATRVAGPQAGASLAAGAFGGPLVAYGYGELSTKVSVSGGRITGVSVPVLKTAEQYSQQLAAQVIPMLQHEVVSAQSARIQAVSGATYTSEAYAQSVQAALDKAHRG